MNKEQLIARAAVKSGLTQREVRNGLNAVILALAEAFENDKNVSIAGLGTFIIRKRNNIKKYLPEDGSGPTKNVKGKHAMFQLGERKYIRFLPCGSLKEQCIKKSSQSVIVKDDNKIRRMKKTISNNIRSLKESILT